MDDPLAEYLFDEAVLRYGSYIEGKLHETDKRTGKPLHKLEWLLQDFDGKMTMKEKNEAMRAMFGGMGGISIG